MSYLDIWICLNEVFWSTLQKRFWSLVCCSLDLVIVHCRTLICLSFHWSAKSSCHWKDAGVFICIIHLSCLLWWSVVCSPSEAHPVSPQNIPLGFFFNLGFFAPTQRSGRGQLFIWAHDFFRCFWGGPKLSKRICCMLVPAIHGVIWADYSSITF